ncbi:MAG: signal peptide peptidase SppA [Chitinophagaceae bacterium]
MKSFLKIFLASLLALVIFSIAAFFILLGIISGLTTPEKVETGSHAVLVLDLSKAYPEIATQNPLNGFGGKQRYDVPALYDVVRLLKYAKTDSSVKGLYIRCGSNANSFGTNEELRNAIVDFKSSNKFVYAYGDVISQGGYAIANAADKIYCNPQGGVDWRGYAMQLTFLKGLLQKLEIEPQIFYAGKFKSATEPLRETQMTEANRLQSTVLLNDLYGHFLAQTAAARKTDTATLHKYANESSIQFAADALKYGLVDGLKYDDEVKEEIRQLVSASQLDKINFVDISKYAQSADYKPVKIGGDRVAVLYATGDIIDGRGERDKIGSETYRNYIRKVRLDNSVKAIVLHINSGGGSALASENIWRELTLARKEKPVVISFGDVAASGAYYLSCNADSIFAQPNTITGSIGVFSILPNMQKFFNNKLGVTFDGVKTATDADELSVAKPLTEMQKRSMQISVDSIYHTFKTRVANGRKKSIEYIDSIGQGRVWSGTRGLELGLVDRIGGLNDAIACAARMAKITDYRLREYPAAQSVLEMLLGNYEQEAAVKAIQKEFGPEGIRMYRSLQSVKQMVGTTQAKLPFEYTID